MIESSEVVFTLRHSDWPSTRKSCCRIGVVNNYSEFIWDFGKLPFPSHLGKYFNKIGKISAKIHEIGKIKAIFELGMTPIYSLKNAQIKSLN